MSEIRVGYSGLIAFVTGLVSIFTASILTLIMTRVLTPEEFGTWSLILGLAVYGTIIQSVIGYWATRESARGIESGKTAVLSSGIFSLGGGFIYIIVAYFIGQQSQLDLNTLFFAVILIPLMSLNAILSSITLGWKPQTVSYGQLSTEIVKIPMALIFIYFLHMGITGIVITFLIGEIASIIILIIYARDKIKNKVKKEYLKKWLKLSWISLYPEIITLINRSDVIIFTAITGSVIGLAFYAAASAIGKITGYSKLISEAAYSKLLQGGKSEFLQENLTRVFYFAIPLAALSISFAKPGLFALNPIYETAAPIVIFLTLQIFLSSLNHVFYYFLISNERVDTNIESTFRDFVKSKLFFIPTLRLIWYGLYIGLLATVLLLQQSDATQLDLVFYWSIISFLTAIPFTVYLYILVRRSFTLTLDLGSIFKYLLISIVVFGMIYLLTEEFLDYKQNVFEFVPNLLIFVGLGIGSYLLATYLVDTKTRNLFKAIVKEVRG